MSKKPIFVGIDNGLSGALVALDHDGRLLQFLPMPTVGKTSGNEVDILPVAEWLSQLGDYSRLVVTLETPGKFAKGVQAISSMWDTYGALRAMLLLGKFRHHRIPPQRWQKVMLPNCKKGDTKPMAKSRAAQLWPDARWLASPKCRNPHDGAIDAALIAEYTRLKL